MLSLDAACHSQDMQRSGYGARWLGAAVALALVAAAVTACDSEDEPPAPQGFVYAALGDSFTAAPGIGKQSTDGCQRSNRNYPHIVADRLDDATLTDVSCGGARSDAVLESQVQADEDRVQPPQIDAVTSDADLVTVGLGVNDLDFVVTAAFGCLLLADSDPHGNPCEKANGKVVPRLVARIQERYADTLNAIAQRAPDAQILVVGYPRLFTGSKGCPDRFPIASGDVDFVRESYDHLNEAIAAAAKASGAEYVDVAAASEGHDICSDAPWINGQGTDKDSGAREYHPLPAEQKAVAGLILDLV
jgi:lysophospholipase L1-like esterase